MTLLQPVVLCGGGGTRLWPASLQRRPKPFLPLIDERTLLQDTLARVAERARFAQPIIVAGEAHAELVRNQAPDAYVIIEPTARNTAPAIALAAAGIAPDTIMLVCPSDHFIANTPAFLGAVESAATLAREGYLVSIGIAPDRPATGYGYIRKGEPLGRGYATRQFVEKPDAERAKQFLQSGEFVWNGGIFVFRAGTLLEELARYRPAMAEGVLRAHAEGLENDGFFRPGAEAFVSMAGESVDYAVMEHTDRAAVVPADMGWSDIGDWAALMDARAAEADNHGNIVRGRGHCVASSSVMIDSDGPRVSVLGAEDLVVVVRGDEILVVSRDAAQGVGALPGAADQP